MIEIIPNWHPVLVHFTVALLSLAVLLHLLALMPLPAGMRTEWKVVARWALWLGALFAVATAVTGWLAYNSVEHDDVSHVAMTDHRNWALATLALYVLLALWSLWSHLRKHKLGGFVRMAFSLALTVAAVLLASTAWRGGELVYRYGLGVMSLPNTTTPEAAAAQATDNAHPLVKPSDLAPGVKPPAHDHSTHKH